MATCKKIKTATGWTYRGIDIVKTAGGNYKSIDGKYYAGQLAWLLQKIDESFAAKQ